MSSHLIEFSWKSKFCSYKWFPHTNFRMNSYRLLMQASYSLFMQVIDPSTLTVYYFFHPIPIISSSSFLPVYPILSILFRSSHHIYLFHPVYPIPSPVPSPSCFYVHYVSVLNRSLDGPNARMGRAHMIDNISSEREWGPLAR